MRFPKALSPRLQKQLLKRFGVYEKVMPVETTPSRWVPNHIDKPDYVIGQILNTRISPEIKDNEQIQRMRNSCNVAANVLRIIQPFILPGVTTVPLARTSIEFE